jgi:hypothetical protein
MDRPLLSEEIKILAQLKSDNVISEKQFDQATKKILSRMSRRPGVAISSEILWSFTGKIILIFVMLILGLVGWGALQIYKQNAELANISIKSERREKTMDDNFEHIGILRKDMAEVKAQIDVLSEELSEELSAE